jgi:predicted CoA-binding protein
MGETVAIVGASTDRRKFGNKAVRAYARRGFEVRPVHPSAAAIEGLRAYRSVSEVPGPIDRVSLYVPPEVGITLLDEIAAVKPGEFWVNPGAESPALLARARELGLEPILACSIMGIGDVPDGGD